LVFNTSLRLASQAGFTYSHYTFTMQFANKTIRKIKFIPGGAKSVPKGSNKNGPENVSNHKEPDPPKTSKDEKKKPKKERKSKAMKAAKSRSPSPKHQEHPQQLTKLDSLRYGGISQETTRDHHTESSSKESSLEEKRKSSPLPPAIRVLSPTRNKKTKQETPTVDRQQHLSMRDSLRYPTISQAPPHHVEDQIESEQSISMEMTEICLQNPAQKRGRGRKKQ
jgi:hypothetical protein